MTEKILLAIDCGTQSLRALLFNLSGHLLDSARVAYNPYVSPHPGWAEQDPEIYWRSLCDACVRLKKRHTDIFGQIAGVGVTTQRNSMVNVDADGKCLRPAMLWLDQRKAKPRFATKGPLKLGLRMVGMDRMLADFQAEAQVNWIRQNQPEIWAKTHKYLQVSGFLNHRLTGCFTDSTASQIGHIPFNYKKQRWARAYEFTARLFPVETEKLPDLVSPGEPVGVITAGASRMTGLPIGLPVIACGSDKGCETLGAGILGPETVSLSFGTTATVQTISSKYFEPMRFMPSYPAPIPHYYNPEVEIFRGFWMITWFKNEFAYQEVVAARKMGVATEVLLNDHLVNTPPGAMGLMVQPYWGPGLKHPEAKGAMIGFGDVHTRAHVYRAVIEGLGFALFEGFLKIQRAGGIPADRAAVSGGASQSDEICKTIADIFNLPMLKGRTHETSGLGAAIVTARGLNLFGSFEEAIDQMVGVQRVFEPDPRNVGIYNKLYSRVYKRIYGALEPLYSEIRDITAYPE